MDPEELFDPSTAPYLRIEDLGGGLEKRVVKEGSGAIPADVAIIWAMKEGRTLSGHRFQKYSSFVYMLQRKNYNPCEYDLFRSMKRGEECWALVPPDMHQVDDYSGESLWFRLYVEEYLEEIPEKTTKEWTFLQRKELALKCIQIGNRVFSTKKFNYSLPLYNRAVHVMQMKKDLMEQLAEEDKAFADTTAQRCWRNAAVTELKASVLCKSEVERLRKYSSVISYCQKVLEKTPQDLKALYLTAKAHMLRGEFEKSKKIIAFCSQPFAEDMTNLLAEITSKEQQIDRLAKARMPRLFDKDVLEAEEVKEKEFALEMDRKFRLDERIAEKERRAAKEIAAKSAMEENATE